MSEPRLLFHGGPVSPNGAICLASTAARGEEPPGWRPLFDNVGLLHLDTPIEIVKGAYADLRIFAGYAGWAPGQLQSEIDEGMWHAVSATYADVFGTQPTELWRTRAAPAGHRAGDLLHLGRGPRAELSSAPRRANPAGARRRRTSG